MEVQAARVKAPPGRPMSSLTPMAGQFRRELLAWYDASKRDLPWRRTSDPYAILVSEVMLQQTQVARVEEYWQRFLERFPTVAALAAATEDEVCSLWSGLGYYRRARSLRAAATVIVVRGGDVPGTAELLKELPGIGAYTAAAVASIAFGEAVPVLDANVNRVLARLTAEQEDVTRAAARRRLERAAYDLLDPTRPGDFNQAMMELGAIICSPLSPRCEVCPVAVHCAAHATGEPERFPDSRGSGRTNAMLDTAAFVVRSRRVLLTTMTDSRGWWPGLWRLPRVTDCRPGSASTGSAQSDDDGAAEDALRRLLREGFGLTCDDFTHVATTTYSVTNNRVTLNVLACRSPHGRLKRSHRARWVSLDEALSLGVPAADRRILERHGPALL